MYEVCKDQSVCSKYHYNRLERTIVIANCIEGANWINKANKQANLFPRFDAGP